MSVDLAYEHPPELYPYGGTPPTDAWDIQIAPVAPLVAWLEMREAAGRPSTLHDVATIRAKAVVATALPRVPMAFDHHDPDHDPAVVIPHLHILVGMRDADGRPVDRALVERVASEAWIAHVDKVVDYAREHPPFEMRWTPDGIAGVDHSHVPAFSCSGFYCGGQPVIVAGP